MPHSDARRQAATSDWSAGCGGVCEAGLVCIGCLESWWGIVSILDKAQVGRVSVLTKRQVSFDAITLALSSKQYVTRSFMPFFFFSPHSLIFLLWRAAELVIAD